MLRWVSPFKLAVDVLCAAVSECVMGSGGSLLTDCDGNHHSPQHGASPTAIYRLIQTLLLVVCLMLLVRRPCEIL